MVLATMNGFSIVNPLENTGASVINLPIYILKYFWDYLFNIIHFKSHVYILGEAIWRWSLIQEVTNKSLI